MDAHFYLRLITTYLRSGLATFLAVVALVSLVTWLQQPRYTSAASVFVAVESGANAGELSQGATYAERQVKSYVRVATSAAVLQPVITNLRLNLSVKDLAGQITATTPNSTSVIQISATNRSSQRAAEIANAVSNSLMDAISKLAPATPAGAGLVKATLIDPAVPSKSPSSPRPLLNLAVAIALGLVLAAGQAMLRQILDNRIRTTADIEAITEAPVLASIGQNPAKTTTDSLAAQDESYRQLRTNIGFLQPGQKRKPTIVISSSQPGEGKTETACNLAKMLAATGASVLLIDADMRRPQVADRLAIDGQIGLSDVLCKRVSGAIATLRLPNSALHVLPAGSIPPNPSELLGSQAMANLLDWAEANFQYVLIDSPPLLPVTDAVVLTKQVSGAVVVARHGVAKRQDLTNALGLLEVGGCRTLGVVLNGVPRKTMSYYHATSPQPNAQSFDEGPTQPELSSLNRAEAETQHGISARREAIVKN